MSTEPEAPVVEQPTQEESKPVDPALTPEQKFVLLGESAVGIQTLKGSYKTNKSNAVKLRKELMTTIKLCEDLRRCVLDTKKAIPTKPRVKKEKPAPVVEVIQTQEVETTA